MGKEMILLRNPSKTPGLVIDSTQEYCIILQAPLSHKQNIVTDKLSAFIRENDLQGKIASIHVLANEPTTREKPESKTAEMRLGWERVKREIRVFAPRARRALLLGTTKTERIVFPGLPGSIEETHGSLFTVPIGCDREIEIVPTFQFRQYELRSVAPYMKRDVARLLKLSKGLPLPYLSNKLPPDTATTVVVDLETTGLDPDKDEITLVGVQWGDHTRSLNTSNIQETLEHILTLVDQGTLQHLVMHNSHFDLTFCEKRVPGFIHKVYPYLRDTLIRARARGELSGSLKHLGNYYTARPGNYSWMRLGEAHDFTAPEYVCEDIDVTWRLYHLWEQAAEQRPIVWWAERITAMNALQTVRGTAIDVPFLSQFHAEHSASVQAMKEALIAEYGVDPNQQEELVRVLRERGYKFSKQTKTGADQLTAEVLEEHGLFDILEYRKAEKLNNSFISKLYELLRPDNTVPHTQTILAAASGRSTMRDINHQQFPRKGPAKKMVISRFEGGKIIQVDMAQAEVRVGIYLSNDTNMHDWLLHSPDGHRENAANAFGKTMGEVTDDERHNSKTYLFRCMYGGSATNEIQERVEVYLKGQFKLLFAYLDKCGRKAMNDLGITDSFGKTANLTKVMDFRGKGGVRRAGLNSPIQGVASHLAQIVTFYVWEELYLRNMQSLVLFGVHDSAVVDTHPEEVEEVYQIIQQAFWYLGEYISDIFPLSRTLPMVGEILIGDNWLAVKDSTPVLVRSIKE